MSTFLLGIIVGFFLFIGYVAYRALRSGHWDTSNLLNVLRAISFFATHPEVFPYLTDLRATDHKHRHPFWYLPHDEFKEVVNTVKE